MFIKKLKIPTKLQINPTRHIGIKPIIRKPAPTASAVVELLNIIMKVTRHNKPDITFIDVKTIAKNTPSAFDISE